MTENEKGVQNNVKCVNDNKEGVNNMRLLILLNG